MLFEVADGPAVQPNCDDADTGIKRIDIADDAKDNANDFK